MLFRGKPDADLIAVRDSLQLSPAFNPARPTWYFVRDLLEIARVRGADEPVAAHLVGAKLQLRFPKHRIRNTSYSTADAQPCVFGGFDIGDTIFHVTVFPTPTLFERCVENLNDGKSVYIVTSSFLVHGTFMAAEHYGAGRFVVTSVEEFVGMTVDELSEFTADESKSQLKSLLEIYNKRVDDVESDRSLLIKLPENLG